MRRARATAIAAALALAGCEQEIIYKEPPLFAQLDGAIVGGVETKKGRNGSLEGVATVPRVQTDEDGHVTMTSLTVRDLIANILDTMDQDRADLFANQLLSEITRQEFIERGYDPEAAFDYVRKNDKAIRMLFTRMPGGEQTPGLFLRAQGGGVYRLPVPKTREMKLRGIDVIFEAPSWRLRWFVP